MSGFLKTLRSGRPDVQFGFLYGPRGNGKTVLLHWLRAEAAKEGGPGEKKIVPIRIAHGDVKSLTAVAQTIVNATAGVGSRIGMTVEANAGVPGLGSIRVIGTGRPKTLSLSETLSESTDPILLTLDEAHEAPPETLGEILNVVQEAGEARPIAAVFAGTPGLEATMRAAHASFWSRGRKLRVGLLADDSAREVLAQPFRDAELEADGGAVAELAATADNYPYFLQLYGEAAWNVVEASGGRTLLPEHVEPVITAADGERKHYYRDRFSELDDVDLLPVARRVAEAFVASAEAPADRRLPMVALKEMLARDGAAREAAGFLVAKGYVWPDASGEPFLTPGIPSMMDYMLAHIPAP